MLDFSAAAAAAAVDEGLDVELVRGKARLYSQTGRWRWEEDKEAFDRVPDVFGGLDGVGDISVGKAYGEVGRWIGRCC